MKSLSEFFLLAVCLITFVWVSILDGTTGGKDLGRLDSAVVVNRNITLNVPQLPPAGRQVIDGNYQSYSIEFSYMLDYSGSLS